MDGIPFGALPRREWLRRISATVMGAAIFRTEASFSVNHLFPDGASASAPAALDKKNMSYYAYVGSRTTRDRNARGDGLSVYRVDPQSAEWTQVQVLRDLVNPSFLAFDRTQSTLYAVHGDQSDISSFRLDPATGKLEFLNRESTEGTNPVHLTVDPGNRWIIVANHITSSLAVLPILSGGAVGKVTDLFKLTGKIGPHRIEQPFPKPHQVQFDRTEQFLAVPDKGVDRVFVFRLDADTGRLLPVPGAEAVAREGAGPRHIAFHPSNEFAYVLNELDSTVMACRFDAASGRLTPLQILPTIPDTFVGNSRAAEIAASASGAQIYASNRGHDSIVELHVDPATGRLTPVGWSSSGGRTPRFFALSPMEDFVFAANEESDTITRFRRDLHSGALHEAGLAAQTGSPVCIVFRGSE